MLVGRKSKEEGSLGQLGQLGGRTGDPRERQSKIVTVRDGVAFMAQGFDAWLPVVNVC